MAEKINRRSYMSKSVKTGAAVTVGGTLLYLSQNSDADLPRPINNLKKDPNGLCDLPDGFKYTVISKHGDTMTDGNTVPDYHDGMGCFSGPNGETILVRNHEIARYLFNDPKSPEPDFAYDPTSSGGTTTIWLNDKMEVTNHYLSLTGTIMNCCGGKTPWNTWISSEEASPAMIGGTWAMGQRHGYNFEVDPLKPLQKAQPLKAMGRFKHEAVAFDSTTGIAYQTEDHMQGCFYRFIPKVKGKLTEGGTLQALKFVDPSINHTTAHILPLNKKHACQWVTIAQPDPEEDNVRKQAQANGAAVFVRGEGMVSHQDGIYFSCSSGGAEGVGQIFKFTPGLGTEGGEIELVFEAKKDGLLEKPDNITVNQWGDLIICEDNSLKQNCLVGLTPEGQIYHIAANEQSEWAGACFSADGKTLFANIHKHPGMTLAIQGPWESLRIA